MKHLLRDESGQTMAISAVFMAIVAIGFLAFATDIGLLFHKKRMAQSAADAVVLAAASEVAIGDTANEQSVANAVAKINGFDTTLATNPARVTLETPTSGSFAGSAYLTATVSQPVKTIIVGAFNPALSTLTVSAQATAGGANTSQTCVCLESGSGQDLTMNNGSSISAPNCGVVVDSSSSNALSLYGGATLSSSTLGTVSSDWNTSSNIYQGGSISSTTKIIQGITSKCSPSMPTPPSYSNCLDDPGGTSTNFTAGPSSAGGIICYKSLTVGANGTADTLNPGIYVISSGSLRFEYGKNGKSNLGGNGVFFYLAGSSGLTIDNGANVNLVAGGSTMSGGGTAASTGNYNGILVYQATGDTTALTTQGGATAYMSGSLYAPSAAVTLGNGSGSTIVGGVVAQSLLMNGGATLTGVASSNQGSLVISYPRMVQ